MTVHVTIHGPDNTKVAGYQYPAPLAEEVAYTRARMAYVHEYASAKQVGFQTAWDYVDQNCWLEITTK